MKELKIESILDLEKIICDLKNGELTLKVQDSKLVYAEITKKIKPDLSCKNCLGK